jgi:hypothetical protein
MAKHLYLKFENDRVVVISLNMSDAHLDVYSKRFNIDLSVLIEMRDVEKAKAVYVNLDSEYLIAYIDKNKRIMYFPAYVQFIQQNFKQTFLFGLKPLGTPKLPKSKSPKIENVVNEKVLPKVTVTETIETETIETEKIDDLDILFKQKELLDSKVSKILSDLESELIFCVENEDFEKAAILRDKINKLK